MRRVHFKTPGPMKWLIIKESRLEDTGLLIYKKKFQYSVTVGWSVGEVPTDAGFGSHVSLHTGGTVMTMFSGTMFVTSFCAVSRWCRGNITPSLLEN